MVGSQVKLVVRPNNQVTITIGDWKRKTLQVTSTAINEHDKVNRKKLVNLTTAYRNNREYFHEMTAIRQSVHKHQLDIIRKKETPKKVSLTRRNTPKSFTRISGQRLRECGAAMDILCGGDLAQCHEVCLTLPGNHEAAFNALAKNTYFATHRIFAYLKKQYDGEVSWFYVWEYQKRGALHLHLAVHHKDSSLLDAICSDIKRAWIRILQDIGTMESCCMFSDKTKRKCTVSQNWQMHSEQIHSSVGGYFSKYAGKEESKQEWYCQKYPISRFWGSSATIKQVIKENSMEYEWDFQGDLVAAEKFHEELIAKILLESNVVRMSGYSFNIRGKYRHKAIRDKDGTVRLYSIEPKAIAQGERLCAYVSPSDFAKTLETAVAMSGCF
jgi:hypothetical protein